MTWGLVATALGLGLRHGIDWDHIAAIADLSANAPSRRRGVFLSFIYAVGHAAVVFALGAAAIIAGLAIPESVESWMGSVVGLTLIGLGVWMLVSLARNGREFRLRSRWMLILDGTFAGWHRVRRRGRRAEVVIEHDHDHDHDERGLGHVGPGGSAGPGHSGAGAHDHAHLSGLDAPALDRIEPALVSAGAGPEPAVEPGANATDPTVTHSPAHAHTHTHSHLHRLALPTEATGTSRGAAAGVGVLHGVGIESPTQIAIFVASTAVGGLAAGLVLLLAWVVGLVLANAALAGAAAFGLLGVERSFTAYATLVVVVAVASIVVGVGYAFGFELLPAI